MRTPIVLLAVLLVGLVLSQGVVAQEGPSIKSSAAYAEVLLRRTELQADIEAVADNYTEQNPKLLDLRAELASIDSSMEKLFAIRPSETGKLTQALGKLMVKRAALQAEYQRLLRSYNKDHPDVKRARRRVDTFDNAIK
jgi:uncharacterized protein involved in exopolysaccharide biosynthesis